MLARTGLLAAGTEPAFDRLARLAAELVGARASFVALVAADRRVLKGSHGVHVPAHEWPVEAAYCRRVVERGAPVSVPDARADPDRPLGMAAYAGVPLRPPGGPVIGTLSVLEPEPREWTPAEIARLSELAAAAAAEVGLRLAARNEQRVQAVLDAAFDGVMTMNARGRVIDVNPAGAELFGRSRADLLGLPLRALFVNGSPRPRPAPAQGPRRLELEALRPDGGRTPVELTLSRTDAAQGGLLIGCLRDLSDVRAAEHAQHEAEIRFRTLVELLPTVTYICDWDERNTIVYISPQIERLTGRPPEAFLGDSDAWFEHVHPDDRPRVDLALRASQRDETPFECEYRLVAADGRVAWVWDGETIVRDADGRPTHSQGAIVDVTAQRMAETALRESQAALDTVAGAAAMVLVAYEVDGTVTLATGQGFAALGIAPGDMLGKSIYDLTTDSASAETALRRAVGGERFTAQVEIGRRRFHAHFTPQFGPHGEVTKVIAVATDFTERHRAEEQVAYLALHDRLTGLPNRAALEDQIASAVARARRNGRAVALLAFNLDHFKLVNDSLGPAAGDEVLREVAARLDAGRRAGERLSRPGGDEFALVLEDLGADARTVAEAAAARVLGELDEPLTVGGTDFSLAASVGIALFPDHAQEPAELLRAASSAVDQAKTTARGGVAVYERTPGDARARLTMTARLRRAIARDELRLHYQPIVALDGPKVIGVEALVRWQDPERGLVPPGEFIPLAETTGLIDDLGEWVLEHACRQAHAWREAGLDLVVSFNASPRQLQRPGFAAALRAQVVGLGLDPARLVVEVTESTAMRPSSRTEAVLEELSALGVQLAIDDFGADYSSLCRLRELPVRLLKLDRSLLRGVPTDPNGAAIVSAVLALARGLGMRAIAEGVETAEQARFLTLADCPLAQGYHLGRPVPAEAITARLTRVAS